METERLEGPQEEQPLANSAKIPDEVQRRFEADEFRTEVEKLRKDLRDSISEIRTPTFWDLAGLFNEFAVGLALLAARVNPRASFRHPHRHVAFLKVWLPMWVKDEALKEWSASAPEGFSERFSSPKRRRIFRNRLDDSISVALQRVEAGASEDVTAMLETPLEPLQVHTAACGTPPEVEDAAPEQEKQRGRRGYREQVRRWMVSKELRTIPDAARRLAVGPDTLKSIMSSKGKRRYGDDTLRSVLKQIGHPEP
jgi:hypothetical protein